MIKLFLGGEVVECKLLAKYPNGNGMLVVRDGTFDGRQGIDICKVYQKHAITEAHGDDVWCRSKGVWLTDDQVRFLIAHLDDALKSWIDYLATA